MICIHFFVGVPMPLGHTARIGPGYWHTPGLFLAFYVAEKRDMTKPSGIA